MPGCPPGGRGAHLALTPSLSVGSQQPGMLPRCRRRAAGHATNAPAAGQHTGQAPFLAFALIGKRLLNAEGGVVVLVSILRGWATVMLSHDTSSVHRVG